MVGGGRFQRRVVVGVGAHQLQSQQLRPVVLDAQVYRLNAPPRHGHAKHLLTLVGVEHGDARGDPLRLLRLRRSMNERTSSRGR